jgi:hypothetical protein
VPQLLPMLKRVLKQWLTGVDQIALFIILLGSVSWSLTMIKSGLIYPFGMGFWGPNGHDGVWHIALIKSLARGSWDMPVFAGQPIMNYHVGFDLIVAFLHKLTFIPIRFLYFQIVPPIVAIFAGVFIYLFLSSWAKSKYAIYMALFFIYFAGSWGYILTLLRNSVISGESLFWSQQSVSTLVNPPFALSLAVLFAGLYFLLKGVKEHSKNSLIITTFLFGVLVQIKVYAGILVLMGLFAAGIWQMIKRRGTNVMRVFAGSSIISVLLFSPLGEEAGKTVVYRPFWFLETMMAVSDRLYWPRFYDAMIAYKSGGYWVKGIIAYSVAFIIFLLGNWGTRIISLKWFLGKLKKIRNLDFIDVIFVVVITAGFLIPLFFVQRGTPWNTIQFVYYSLLFSGILAGICIGEWLDKSSRMWKFFAVSVVVILTIPTSFGTLLYNYLPGRPPARISLEELEALSFLEKQPEGVVLTFPYDEVLAREAQANPPRPLYLYESTAYVSAFSNKSVYLEDEVNLDITGYNWRERRSKLIGFYDSLDHQLVWTFLRDNNIEYVYWIKGQRARLGEGQLGIEMIFENDLVSIYKVI